MRSFPITSVGYLGQAPMSLWGLLGVWVIGTGKCDWPLQAALSGSIIKAPGFAGGYLIVDNGDVAVLQRQHLEGKLHREGGRRRNQPALVICSRKAFSGNGKLSLLLHHGGRFRRQDRIAIIADKLAVIGLAVRKSAQIAQWLRTRWHPLEVERVLAPPNLHKAGRTVSGKCRQGEHHRREGAEEQSVAVHLMAPSIALSQKSSPWHTGFRGNLSRFRRFVFSRLRAGELRLSQWL